MGRLARFSLRAFFGCLFCLSLSCGVPALAGEKAGLYLEAGTSLYVLERPEYAPLKAFNFPSDGTFIRIPVSDDKAEGPLATLTLGLRTDSPFFLELTSRYFSDSERFHGSHSGSEYGTGYVGYFPLSGNHSARGTNHPTFTDVRTRFSEYGARLVGGYAIELGSGMTISPLVGYEVMRMDQDYDMDFWIPAITRLMQLREDVDALYHGVLTGVGLRGQWGGYRASLTGTAAGYLVRSGYEGSMTHPAFKDSVSLVDHTVAAGLELSADLSRSWGPWSAGLNAQVRSLSYVPEIVASRRSTDATLGNGSPVHLTGHRSLGYGLGFKLSYAF